MWLLVLICTLTAVDGVPVHLTEETTGHATDNVTVTSMLDAPKPDTAGVGAIPLNDTQTMTAAAGNTTVQSMLDAPKPDTAQGNATVTSMLDAPKPDTAAVGAIPLNDTQNMTPAAGNATVQSMLDAPKPDTAQVSAVPLNDTVRTPAAVSAVPLNDTQNMSPAAGNATAQSMLDAPKPDTAGVGAVPLNDTQNMTPAAGNATVQSMLDAPKPDTAKVSAVPLNDTQNMTPAAGNATVQSMLDASKPDPAEVSVVPLNDTVRTPAAGNATVQSMLDATKPDPAGVGAIPLNDTQTMTPAAGNATVQSMLDAPKPDTAEVGAIPLNDTQNMSPAAGNATVQSMLDAPKPDTAEVGVVPLNDTHNVTSPAAGTAMLKPQTAEAETLEELQDDMIVQEGDILMPEDRNAVETLWADATVPYSIGYELADQEFNILSAFRMISDFTCIRFVPHTTELNYLQFVPRKGCASFVGCRGGAQKLYYSNTCSVGNLAHELIHALGLHHEHTRQDRDQFISVQWNNIIPKRKNNFKVQHGNTLNLPYDLDSITHYGPYFFSVDGSETMVSKYSGAHIGQRTHLSQLDIQRLNRLYHCAERMRG